MRVGALSGEFVCVALRFVGTLLPKDKTQAVYRSYFYLGGLGLIVSRG